MGEGGELIKKMAKNTGRQLPDRLANPPELHPFLEIYYRIFMELTHDRTLGFGIGPIPTMTIIAYCGQFGIQNQALEDVLFFVRRLDLHYVKHANKDTNAGKGLSGVRKVRKKP